MKKKFITSLFIVLVFVCIAVLAIFFIPQRIDNSFYNTTITFNEIIITKFFFDKDIGLPNNIDYRITEQESISSLRNLLYKIKVNKFILNKDNTLNRYYKVTFKNTKSGEKISFNVNNEIYFTSNTNEIRRYKIINDEVARELVDYIETLIEDIKSSIE